MEQQRKPRVPAYLKQSYQPEYDRLNVDSTPPGIDLRTQKPVTQNAPVRNFHGESKLTDIGRRGRVVVDAHTVPGPAPKPRPQQRPAVQLPVQVGNHEDQMWFDDELVAGVSETQEAPIGYASDVDNNEYMDIPGLPGHHNLVRALNAQQVEVSYCTICKLAKSLNQPWTEPCGTKPDASDTARWVEDRQKKAQQPEPVTAEPTEKEFTLSDVMPGEFVVLYKNQIVYNGVDEATVKTAVENIMLNYKIKMEDILVFKRLQVNFGVSLS